MHSKTIHNQVKSKVLPGNRACPDRVLTVHRTPFPVCVCCVSMCTCMYLHSHTHGCLYVFTCGCRAGQVPRCVPFRNFISLGVGTAS